MTVDTLMLPLSTMDRRRKNGQTGTIEGRSPPSGPISADRDDELPIALVSTPPLIPRIYPGL